MKDGQVLIPRPDFPQQSRCIWIIRAWPLPTRRPPPGHLGELKLLLPSQCRVMCASNWQLVKKKRRLPRPRWNEYAGRNKRRDATHKKREEQELRRARRCGVMCGMEREGGARRQEEYNRDHRASGACPDLITDPLGWCEHEWSKEGKHHQSPVWAGDLWSASPMHHQQLASKMVCSWKLVKAYQWTRQSTYICPPAPHVIEAFNHKVNHDTHKELGAQEHAVLQYTHALQYVSYCNDERYKDQIAPAVKAFWDEVAKPFRQQSPPELRPVPRHGQGNASQSYCKDPGLWSAGPHCPGLWAFLCISRELFTI